METEEIMIYSSSEDHMVYLVKDFLLENGIESTILDKKDSMFLIGELELYVDKKDEQAAQNIMKEFNR